MISTNPIPSEGFVINIYEEVRLVTEAVEESFAIVKSVQEYKKKDENAQRDIKVSPFTGHLCHINH